MNNNVALAAPPMSAWPPTATLGSIASRWRMLHGQTSWDGLLAPIDADLRAFVIAYGELAAAAFDGFNTEKRSPHAGLCLYSRASLLTACGVSCPGHYTVTKFLYAPSGLWLPNTRSASPAALAATEPFFLRPLEKGPFWREVNWMGYVAVATDQGASVMGRRDIVVAWRGSVAGTEYLSDLDCLHARAESVLGAAAHKNALVHHGFLSVYTSKDEKSNHNKTSVQHQALGEVRRLMEVYKDEVTSITVTGHSLGASLATLNAVDMVAHGVNVPPASSNRLPCPVTAILFGSPHVGNGEFRAAFASFPDLRALSVINKHDLVPGLPPSFMGYVGVATATLRIDTDKSPYLRPLDFGQRHNLEVYLHGVAGYQGDGKFSLVVKRDVVLVNKWADLLNDVRLAPANWWVVQNKCMVRGADAHWTFDDMKEE